MVTNSHCRILAMLPHGDRNILDAGIESRLLEVSESQSEGHALDLKPDAFARVCELMKAKLTIDYHEEGFFSLDFVAGTDELSLTFGLKGNQVMLHSLPGTRRWMTQFIFECNAVAFHPKATQDFYMLLFHNVRGSMISPKMLIVGDSHGVTKMVQYSIPESEFQGEIEFPLQV